MNYDVSLDALETGAPQSQILSVYVNIMLHVSPRNIVGCTSAIDEMNQGQTDHD